MIAAIAILVLLAINLVQWALMVYWRSEAEAERRRAENFRGLWHQALEDSQGAARLAKSMWGESFSRN